METELGRSDWWKAEVRLMEKGLRVVKRGFEGSWVRKCILRCIKDEIVVYWVIGVEEISR